MLEQIANKLERGYSLAHGPLQGGGCYIERDLVIAVLRAVSEGREPSKVLFGSGALPQPRSVILDRVALERARFGAGKVSKSQAINLVARKDGRRASAVKAEYFRAVREDRDHWQTELLEGRWPTSAFFDMSDQQIEKWMNEELASLIVEDGSREERVAIFRAQRDADIATVLEKTGWHCLNCRKVGGGNACPKRKK